MTTINQCDGCRRKLPVNESGIHYEIKGKKIDLYMVCEKKRYLEPKGVGASYYIRKPK